MATQQEQLNPQANEQAEINEPRTDYARAQTPDQSDIPHHAGVDPAAPPLHPETNESSEEA
jgi:hypothetical protein